jgi:ADP-L-glycero-D-manno-heptose 6-epimerase
MHDLADGRTLVTGGAGFIGSALIWELNRRSLSNILVADHLRTTEKWKNLVPLRFDDYLEAAALESLIDKRSPLLEDVRTVFHLGACSATTETDAAYLVHNNYEYTKKLAAWCLEHEARFVYASSAATYGGLEEGLNEMRPLHSLRPLNMYGYSKHLFDCYAEKHGFLDKIAGLKFFNVYGPNEDHKDDMRSVVHKAYHQILETGSVNLFKSYRPEFADGCQRRDFLYVKDAVRMAIYLAQHADVGGLYNLGTGSSRTWLDLATAIFTALDRQPNIRFIEMPERLQGKYQYFTQAEIGKLRAAGYRDDVTPVEDAVKDYVVNYLETGSKLEP